jgi:hypothetical protein
MRAGARRSGSGGPGCCCAAGCSRVLPDEGGRPRRQAHDHVAPRNGNTYAAASSDHTGKTPQEIRGERRQGVRSETYVAREEEDRPRRGVPPGARPRHVQKKKNRAAAQRAHSCSPPPSSCGGGWAGSTCPGHGTAGCGQRLRSAPWAPLCMSAERRGGTVQATCCVALPCPCRATAPSCCGCTCTRRRGSLPALVDGWGGYPSS